MTLSPPPVQPSTLKVIGNTPVVQLQKLASPDDARVLVKLEYFNPTGSYKDRMALAMIEEAEKRGDLRKGMTVVECTGGSTGSSLAFICAVKGYPFTVVSSDAFALEKRRTMQAFGAELILEPSLNGKTTPDLMPRMMARASTYAEDENVYFTNQFHNADILVGQEGLGRELLYQVEDGIDAFCAGIGTAGLLMGVSRAFRQAQCKTTIVGLEPASSPLLSRGEAGSHHVEGVSLGFVPPLLDTTLYNEVRPIDENHARTIARRLAREEGILAGTSTGMNIAGALQLARELGKGRTVVTVAVDTGLKYLTGDLYAD